MQHTVIIRSIQLVKQPYQNQALGLDFVRRYSGAVWFTRSFE
jgi:hypothetical protein